MIWDSTAWKALRVRGRIFDGFILKFLKDTIRKSVGGFFQRRAESSGKNPKRGKNRLSLSYLLTEKSTGYNIKST